MKSPLCRNCGKPLMLLTDPWPTIVERATGNLDLDRHEWGGQVCLECGFTLCNTCRVDPGYASCRVDGSLMLPAKYVYMKDSIDFDSFVETGMKWLMDP